MQFDITQFIDKGFTTLVAVAAVYFVVQLGRIFTKYVPKALLQANEFAIIWRKFVKAVDSNAVAVEKNTIVTDLNCRHSVEVLEELTGFRREFSEHDQHAVDLRASVLDLIEVIDKDNNSEEVIALLEVVISRMTEQDNELTIVRNQTGVTHEQ